MNFVTYCISITDQLNNEFDKLFGALNRTSKMNALIIVTNCYIT